MIAGATYKNGIALTSDGAVYVTGPAAVASPNAKFAGATVNPPAKTLTPDGVVYVRFL